MVKRASQETSADQQQPYDNLLKSLFEGQEKQLLPYFLPGAEYLTTLNVEVMRPPLRVDRVYKVKYKGKRTIVHLEFESGSNNDMADRLLDITPIYVANTSFPLSQSSFIPSLQKWRSPLCGKYSKNRTYSFSIFRSFPYGNYTPSNT